MKRRGGKCAVAVPNTWIENRKGKAEASEIEETRENIEDDLPLMIALVEEG